MMQHKTSHNGIGLPGSSHKKLPRISLKIQGGEPVWLFDLDNTLYPAHFGLFDQIEERMNIYIAELLGLARTQSILLRREYFLKYGTTLSGLMQKHQVDPAHFLSFVHDIDLSALSPAPDLMTALARLRGRKLIFTNGSTVHAEGVLKTLGIHTHFEDIIDIESTGFIPKPAAQAYSTLLKRTGIIPHTTVFFEDTARNLKPAAELGMQTVLVERSRELAFATKEKDGAQDKQPDSSFIHHRTDNLPAWLTGVCDALGYS